MDATYMRSKVACDNRSNDNKKKMWDLPLRMLDNVLGLDEHAIGG